MLEVKKLELSPSISIIIAGIVVAAAILYTNAHPGPAAAVAAADPVAGGTYTNVSVRAASSSDHIVGSPSAPVVLIEYSDFQCPFCSLVYPTLKKIVGESNGRIAWVMRNLPLESIHQNARPGALAAECVAQELGNDAYWKFADMVFANQSKISPAYFEQVALQLGAQKNAYESCLVSPATAKKIDDDAAEAISNGGQGTPYTIVYGGGKQIPISGALPYASFMSVIKTVQTRP